CYNERHKKCYQPQPQAFAYAFIRLGIWLLPFPSCSGMQVRAPSSFGQWLRQSRKRLDLTQAELPLRAGCSTGTIRKLESGELRPSRQLAEILAGQLAIAPDERAAFVRFARAEALLAGPDLPVHTHA